jgi:inulin fructotransferase (DFA-I-forming)
MLILANSSEILVATNHFLRDHEPWTPFLGVDNGLNDLYGLLSVSGSNNSVVANHFSQIIDSQSIRPAGATPVIIRLTAGVGNFVSNNHVVAMDVHSTTSDSCFEAQVDALLTTAASDGLAVTAVMVDSESARNTILDSGTDPQVIADRAVNALRATPTVGFPSSNTATPATRETITRL